MAAAIGVITLGVLFVYSALKGIGIVDVLAGVVGSPLNPAGGKREYPVALADAGITQGDIDAGLAAGPLDQTIGAGEFKGPHAAKLNSLRKIAETRYRLKVSQVCRPVTANYGAANSLHKSCRAMDLTGATADKVAFSNYAATLSWVTENYCDQAGRIAPGYDHSDHVHIGA